MSIKKSLDEDEYRNITRLNDRKDDKIGLNRPNMGQIMQKKTTSSWSHQYRPVQKKTDTYKFGKNLEGIELKYIEVLNQLNRKKGAVYRDSNFPPIWESIRGNGKNDYRM